jgi:thiamine monophosphate kinase
MLASGSLLAAVSPEAVRDVEQACRDRGLDCFWVGKLTPPEGGFKLIRNGETVDLAPFSSDEVARALADSSH